MRDKKLPRLLKLALVLPILLVSTSFATQLPRQAMPSLSATSLSFGTQAIDTTSPAKSIVITNRATSPLFIFKVSASSDFAVTDNCRRPLRQNENCQITVTFSPTFPGDTQGTITILDSSSASPHRLTMSGTGAAAPGLTSEKPR
jgi:hypothetical protein